jgi:hypothetical protein
VKNTDGLIPWQPGQSGNPNGRPKSKPFKDALKRALKDEVDLDKVAASLVAKAMTGDVSALKEIADRLDGKVTQPIGGDDEAEPITFRELVTGVPRAADD